MLRNLEAKLGGLVEGAFSRAFKSSVQPVELARKLAKEMEDNQTVSVSRVYVPNHYRVFLSPRTASSSRATSRRCARSCPTTCSSTPARSRSRSSTRPQVEFLTDERLDLGEFGIQAQLLASPEEEQEQSRDRRRPRPRRATSGTRWSTRPTARRAGSSRRDDRRQALLVGGGRRTVLSGSRVVLGRSRECDIVVERPERLAPARRAAPRRGRLAGRRPRLDERHQGERPPRGPAAAAPGDEITLGLTDLTFELE